MTNVKIKISNWLDKIFVWPVVVYRLWKFGYTYRRIYLGERKWALVDVRDYYWLKSYRWILFGNESGLYAARTRLVGPKKTVIVRMHREIMGEPKGYLVDHKNRNSLDNRRDNLRRATHSQNACNRSKRKTKTTSRYIGVYFQKSAGKWATFIRNKGKKTWLGYYVNEVEAAKAYDAAARKYHGEFASLNFPEEKD